VHCIRHAQCVAYRRIAVQVRAPLEHIAALARTNCDDSTARCLRRALHLYVTGHEALLGVADIAYRLEDGDIADVCAEVAGTPCVAPMAEVTARLEFRQHIQRLRIAQGAPEPTTWDQLTRLDHSHAVRAKAIAARLGYCVDSAMSNDTDVGAAQTVVAHTATVANLETPLDSRAQRAPSLETRSGSGRRGGAEAPALPQHARVVADDQVSASSTRAPEAAMSGNANSSLPRRTRVDSRQRAAAQKQLSAGVATAVDKSPRQSGSADARRGSSASLRTVRIPERRNPILKPYHFVSTRLESKPGAIVNGPALLEVPTWVEQRLGRYYLYSSHSSGQYIRFSYADAIVGPYTLEDEGVLELSGVPHCGGYLANPYVYVDDVAQRIVLYFHCGVCLPSGAASCVDSRGAQQLDRPVFVAVSRDGIEFNALPTVLFKEHLNAVRIGAWVYHFSFRKVFRSRADELSLAAASAGATGVQLHLICSTPFPFPAPLLLGDRLHLVWSHQGRMIA
jgi:hypothetical protein